MNIKNFLSSFSRTENKPLQANMDARYVVSYKSSLYDSSQFTPYNPDSLVQNKGLDIYDTMLNDDQVKAAYMTKKMLILGRKWTIEAVSSDAKDIEIADFINYCLTDGFGGIFYERLFEMLTCIQYGFSVTEKKFKKFNNGRYTGMIGLKDLRIAPPHSFEIQTNEKGEFEFLKQTQQNEDVVIDKNKMKYIILYTYNKKFGNLYGTSDFRAAYKAWFSKDIIIKFWNMFLERFNSPIPMIQYPVNQSQSTSPDSILDILKTLQNSTGLVFPDNLDIKLMEAHSDTQNYERAISKYNTMISRSFLLPELLGFTDHDTGSQALGREQFDMFYMFLEREQRMLEYVINDKIITDLVNMNYKTDNIPRFRYLPIETEDKEKLFNIWYKGVELGVVHSIEKDEKYIRELVGMPASETTQNKPVEQEKPKQEEPVKKDEVFSEKIKFTRNPNMFEERADIFKVAEEVNILQDDMMVDVQNSISDIQEYITKKVIRDNYAVSQDFEKINKINIPDSYISTLENAFIFNFKKIYTTADKTATDNLKNILSNDFAEMQAGSLLPKDALNYLNSKSITLTDIEKEFMLKNIKEILYSGIRNGKSNDDIVYELEGFFEQYKAYQKLPSGEVKQIETIPGRLMTITRTNLSDIYNISRLNSYNKPEVAEFVEALQYSAIMDDAVTPFCEAHNERIYKRTDPIWNSLTPPNHFNCRSTVIPVVTGDNYKISKPLAIQQPVRFGGNPQ